MEKLAAFWRLLHVGECVEDPASWKNRQVTANQLGAIIMAIIGVCHVYGISVPVDDASALAIGGGILAAVNVVLTIVTTNKIGLPARPVLPSANTAANTGMPTGISVSDQADQGTDSHNGLG
jgi:hypothetical protein